MNTNITIIGLGLIGGSLAKALKSKSGDFFITAIDPSQATLDAATRSGAADRGYTAISEAISDSDFVFIAVPVDMAFDCVQQCLKYVQPGCILTDLCSTKSDLIKRIAKEIGNIHFIGGHPMAGSEKFGFLSSDKSLFENAYYILIPTSGATGNDLERLTDLVLLTGAIPLIMEAEQHDLAVATISHLPHVAAACLVNILTADQDNIQKKLAAGGFRDITRIASSNPFMWQAICSSNKQALSALIDQYIQGLTDFSAALKTGNDAAVLEAFQSSKRIRDSMDSNIRGLIPNTYVLTSDVEDKPGVIGSVANLLSSNGINIKNIAVTNSREYEGGVLNMVFYDKDEYLLAHKVLLAHGYKVSDL